MERITIMIDTSNDAFRGMAQYEVARVLYELANNIMDGKEPETLLDINGNKVGKVVYE